MLHRKMVAAAMVCSSLTALGCVTDAILMDADGNEYRTVRIGQQTWMAENLRLDVGEGSYCYNNDPAKCLDMGRLYSWEAAAKAASRIPGWHLPSREEWLVLIASAGPDSVAYEVITSTEFGFSPQWSGVRVARTGEFRAGEVKTANHWS